jgi:hypothetical protein
MQARYVRSLGLGCPEVLKGATGRLKDSVTNLGIEVGGEPLSVA